MKSSSCSISCSRGFTRREQSRGLVQLRRSLSMSAISVLVMIAFLYPQALALTGMVSDSAPETARPLSWHSEAATAMASAPSNGSIADAGPDQNVTVGSNVILNGSGSVPSEGATIDNYTWRIAKTGATVAILYGEQVTFVALEAGLYTANLTIKDSKNHTSYDFALIVTLGEPATFLERYWLVLIIGVAVGIYAIFVASKAVMRIVKGQPLISTADREKFKLSMKKLREINRKLLSNRMGLIGSVLLTAFIIVAIIGPMIAPYDVKHIDPDRKFEKPSQAHWLGTDQAGVDILSEVLVGSRTSIIIGVFSAVIASLLGTVVGLYAGYVGGWKDEVVMRLNDIVLSIPWLVLMIVVAAFLGTINLVGVILIIGLTGWSMTARMVRAQVLSIREKQFVERARAIGASDTAILRRHIFPNTFPLVFANTILTVAIAILSEATLSYLRLRPQGTVTWGTILSYASQSSAVQIGLWGWLVVPGMLIVGIVLAFTLMGYALDEILNPKLRRR